MSSDSHEPSRRSKHRPSSVDDSGEHSKRRKHRHHQKHDADVEEREDEPFSRYVPNSRPDSDVEEGEIIDEYDDRIVEIDSAHAEVGDRSSPPLEDNGNDSKDKLVKNGKVSVVEDLIDGSRTLNEGVPLQKSSYGNISNGDTGLVLLKENYSVPKEDVQSRSRSHSRGRGRERSRSVSLFDKVSPMKMTHKKDDPRFEDAKKTNNDSDDERMAVRNWDSRHGYRDGVRDNDRGRSSSYSRYRPLDSHQSLESWDSERERSRESLDKDQYGRDVGSSRKREKTEDHDGDSNKQIESSRDSERQTERKRYRERERERDKVSDKERARVRVRDREQERTREREERELEREKERRKDMELERGRESERNRSRDRESYGVRGSGRNRSRDRERYGDRESRRNRSRDRERYGDRESGRNRSRDRERDRDDERFPKNRNYENKDSDGYEDRHMYKDLRSSKDYGTDHNNRVKKDDETKSRRDEEEQEEYQERVTLQLVDQEEDDVDRIKEESRRRRQAILEKYKMQQQQQQQQQKPQSENDDKVHVVQVAQEVVATIVSPENYVMKDEDDVGNVVGDPSLTVSKFPSQNGVSASKKISGAVGLGEGTPKSERSGDMFCDDIFGDSPAGVRKTGKGDGLAIERGSLHDNWDDAEGYYSFRLGEILDGRYEVAAAHGKGVFSTVVRAKDLKAGPGDPEEVAIKIIRNNEHMHKAGKEELIILKKLVGADPEDKRHCVRFLSSFKYRNHLCLVFESLNMNLREVLKKFGRNIGLKLTAVRLYSKQLFIALKHLRNCGVLHSDIKPDNMLVNEAKNVLKLCDFGNAMFAGKNEITPYLVSRFYRAPEIILGLPYDHPLDIWSVGCCIFELYTGKVLFPGATNNDMLRLHMELKGLFPKKMIRKGAFTDQHFDQDLNFLAIEEDPVTKKTMRRLITSIKPKDIGAIITGFPGEDPKMLVNFKDLLEKIFILDPDKRLTVSQALSHPFITGK